MATVLEGSVQKAGDQVLINVQLIDARSDSPPVGAELPAHAGQHLRCRGRGGRKIAAALKARLSPAEAVAVASVPTRNPAAYDAYLRGERFFNQAFSTGDFTLLPKAVKAYRQAADHDPAFALAWANLAFEPEPG